MQGAVTKFLMTVPLQVLGGEPFGGKTYVELAIREINMPRRGMVPLMIVGVEVRFIVGEEVE